MIPPSAGLVHLDRAALLDAIAARLEVRPNPGDPSWALVEEIARMVEALAGRLDALPAELLQAAASRVGVALVPARPAFAIVLAQPNAEGALLVREEIDATSFVAPRDETRGPVSFVPCEPRVNLVTGGLGAWHELIQGELFSASTALSGLFAARPGVTRARAFALERVRYRLGRGDPTLRERLGDAIAGLARRKLGWIRAEVLEDADGLSLLATIEPNATLRRISSRVGSIVLADWGTLDDLTWRPPLLLNPRLTGPGAPNPIMSLAVDGRTLEIAGVPPTDPLEDLLVRKAAPAPDAWVDALWNTLRGQALGLPASPVSAVRELGGEASGSWIEAALRVGRWPPTQVEGSVCVVLRPKRAVGTDSVRIALAFERESAPPSSVKALWRRGEVVTELGGLTLAWELPVPGPEGRVHRVRAWDIEVPAGADADVIVVVEGAVPASALLNATLAINAPRSVEGHRVPIQGLSGQSVQLRARDIVSPEVLWAELRGALRGATLPCMSPGTFPLARFQLEGGPTLKDLEGTIVDEGTGVLTLPGVDATVGARALLPGQVIELSWVRRTDGALGVLAPGGVRVVEQAPAETTTLSRVWQPYPTVGGGGGESPAGALTRVLVPTSLAPILPGELERDVLVALGPGYEGWLARVHTVSEEVLDSAWRWTELPLPGGSPGRPEAHRHASGELRVGLGRPDRVVADAELQDARIRLEGWFTWLRQRYGMLRRLVLSPLRPLRLAPTRPLADPPALPLFTLAGLAPDDRLIDPAGEARAPVAAGRLCDAVITRVEAPASQGPWTADELSAWLEQDLGLAGVQLRARVWSEGGAGSPRARLWDELRLVEPAELTALSRPLMLARERGVEALGVAVGVPDVALSEAQLHALTPLVLRWVGRYARRLGQAWTLGSLRELRFTQAGARGLVDGWGEVRAAEGAAPLDAVPLEDGAPIDACAPARPARVEALSAALRGALEDRGWRWLASVWLPRDALRMSLRRWDPREGVVEVGAMTATTRVSVGPRSGQSTAAEMSAVERIALAWWDGYAARCPEVRRVVVGPLRRLRAQVSGPAVGPVGVPTAWTGRLGSRDLLVEGPGRGWPAVPRVSLVDALITQAEALEDPDAD